MHSRNRSSRTQPHWVPVRYDLEEEKPEGNSGSADGTVVYTALQFPWLQGLCAPHAAWKNDYCMCGEYVLLRTTIPSFLLSRITISNSLDIFPGVFNSDEMVLQDKGFTTLWTETLFTTNNYF